MTMPKRAAAAALAGPLFLLLALLATPARAQGVCEEWRGEPAVCEPYLRFHYTDRRPQIAVFLPFSVGSQAGLVQAFHAAFDPAANALNSRCRKALTQMACLTALPTCAEEKLASGNATLNLPRFACRPVCENVNTVCKSAGIEVDCTVREPITGLPFYPQHVSQFADVTVPCFGTAAVPAKVPVDRCPRQFLYNSDEDQCLPECPESLTLHSNTHHEVVHVLKGISVVLNVIQIIYIWPPYLLVKALRTLPFAAHFYVFLESISVLALVFGLWMPANDWLCVDATHLRDDTSLMCLIQDSHLPRRALPSSIAIHPFAWEAGTSAL